MKAFYDNGIVTDPIIMRHKSGGTPNLHWYPEGTPVVSSLNEIRTALRRVSNHLDAVLFFETPFDWDSIEVCRRWSIKTVLCTMYEWTPRVWPQKPDYILAPSKLDYDYFLDEFGSDRCIFIPVPVETKHWRRRTTAMRFLHNAGNIGHREHKGTRELLKAIPLVKNPDFKITIRAQAMTAFQRMAAEVPEFKIDNRVSITPGEIPYENLWDDADVYIAPEKLNGLSLPLQEAFAAGLLVMTTDRYPMNTWLPNGRHTSKLRAFGMPEFMPGGSCEIPDGATLTIGDPSKNPLIPVDHYERACIGPQYREFEEAIVTPEAIAQTIDAWCGRDITDFSDNSAAWATLHSWERLKPRYEEFFARVVQ
jgi:hypothetical protein